MKFDPLPQLSNPAAPRLRAEEPRACRRDNTQLDMHAEHRRTHKQAHKRRHTYRKLKATCVPPWPATRSTNRLPIAFCVMSKSIECNIAMQMSSTENAGKENRGLTLILARSGSPAAPMCGTRTYSLPRESRCRSKECHRSQHCTSSTFPWMFDEALCQAQAPQSLLLPTTSSCVGAQPLRLVVPRRWPRPHLKAP